MKKKATLDSFISMQEITMVAKRIRYNPILKELNPASDAVHYQFHLAKPGKEIQVYLSLHMDEDPVSLTDVMFMLALDATGCRMLEGLDAFRDEWNVLFGGSDGNLKELEAFWHEYTGRCGQAEKLRSFLGECAFRQLIAHFEEPHETLD